MSALPLIVHPYRGQPALKAEPPDQAVVALREPQHPNSHHGPTVTVRLAGRAVRIAGDVYEYGYALEPEPSESCAAKVLLSARPHLDALFGERDYLVYTPGKLVFSSGPAGNHSLGLGKHSLTLELRSVHSGRAPRHGGAVDVVYHYAARSMLEAYARVGHRYVGPTQPTDHEGLLGSLVLRPKLGAAARGEYRLLLDAKYLAVPADNALAAVSSLLAPLAVDTRHPDVRQRWLRETVGRLARDPRTGETFVVRGADFDKALPQGAAPQPWLLASDERGRCVELLPETVVLLGAKDNGTMSRTEAVRVLAATAASPLQRHACTQRALQGLGGGAFGATLAPEETAPAVRIEAPSVSFGDLNYPADGGSFQRWMRNGLQRPCRINDWIFIYPQVDAALLDIWLRSLRDLAHVAFGMRMAEPKRVGVNDCRRDMLKVVEDQVTPSMQLALIMIQPSDADRTYKLLKTTLLTRRPVISQFVRTDTIRRRHSIAAILSKLALQINAKLGGPLWHVSIRSPSTAPLMEQPTMVVGISRVPRGGETFSGLAASLDRQATKYADRCLHGGADARALADAAERLQLFLRDAFQAFASRNGFMPEHIVVYSTCEDEEDYGRLRDTDLWAVKSFLSAVANASPPSDSGAAYAPRLSFLAAHRCLSNRIFKADVDQGNVDPGTLVDNGTHPDFGEHFTIAGSASEGTVIPATFCVLYDDSRAPLRALQSLTHVLAFLYPNATRCTKYPAPVEYARKLAETTAETLRSEPPHPRFAGVPWYL